MEPCREHAVMPSRPSLVVCPECSNYVKASECRCPSCGICFRGREGRVTTAAAILTMGLMSVACGSEVRGGDGGAGGAGGDMPTTSGGYGNPTSAAGYTTASSGSWTDSASTGGGAGGDGGAGANGGVGGAGANGGAGGNGGS